TNTRAVWLRFGAFLSPPFSSLQFHWPLATGHSSLPSCDHHATDRDCSLSTTSVDRRGPPSMPRAGLVTALPARQGANMLRNATFSGFGRNFSILVFDAS